MTNEPPIDCDDECTCGHADYLTAIHCPIHGRRGDEPPIDDDDIARSMGTPASTERAMVMIERAQNDPWVPPETPRSPADES